jgi:hypothetical protein
MLTEELVQELEDLSTRLKQWFGNASSSNTHVKASALIDEAVKKLKNLK